jgi:tripartite ATP-independent transporter DctM subunit
MFACLLALLLLGVPIAFSLSVTGIVFAYTLWGAGALNLLISAAWGTMNNFALVAVPLFIFMALILQKAQIVEDIYDAFYKWSGGLRGGLGVATVMVGAILGACSGVVAAGVIGLGLIGLPQMLKQGYNKRISMGAVMAGGTLGQLIPPSTNMVVYGSVTGVSVGALFAGGITSGLFLALLYCLYILIRSYIDRDLCPALPLSERVGWKGKLLALNKVAIPLLLIITVLGSILKGVATPSEAAAVGAFVSFVYSITTRRINWKDVKDACFETLGIAVMTSWIVIGAGAFGSVFSGTGGNQLVANIALSLPGGKWVVLAAAMAFILFLGMFLEPTAMIMLAAPLLSPILQKLGFDILWWGLLFQAMLQVAYLSPPFGFTLFYMRGCVSEDVPISEIYISSLPYIAIQVVGLILLVVFPQIATWLPNYLTR